MRDRSSNIPAICAVTKASVFILAASRFWSL
jgi:hypothetical protein